MAKAAGNPVEAALSALDATVDILVKVQDSGGHNRHVAEALGHLGAARDAILRGVVEFQDAVAAAVIFPGSDNVSGRAEIPPDAA